MEVISPELVLVDPELARVERARLLERASVAALIDAEALRVAVERTLGTEAEENSQPQVERVVAMAARYRRHAFHALLLLSLLANGVVLAVLVSRDGHEGTSRAAFVRPTSSTPALSASVPSSIPSRGAVGRTAAAEPLKPLPSAPNKAQLERRIFASIIRAPEAKLPADLIDRATGLAKNNLQVACHRARAPRSFLCTVGLAGQRRGSLLVRYRAARGSVGVFTWVRGT